MTIWEIITVGPFWLLVMGAIATPLIPIGERHGSTWAKNLVLVIAVVGATAVVWFITNLPPVGGYDSDPFFSNDF